MLVVRDNFNLTLSLSLIIILLEFNKSLCLLFMLDYVVLCIVLCYCVVLRCVVLYCVVLCCVVLCCVILGGSVVVLIFCACPVVW